MKPVTVSVGLLLAHGSIPPGEGPVPGRDYWSWAGEVPLEDSGVWLG